MISKKERTEIEKIVRSLYQDVLQVEIKEDPDNESSLLLSITRGCKMPAIRIDRKTKDLDLKQKKEM